MNSGLDIKTVRLMPKSQGSLALRLWPGHSKLWLQGDIHSLLVSLLFAWVMLLTWLATFVWPEWLNEWCGSLWTSRVLLWGLWIAMGFAAIRSLIQSTLGSRGTGQLPAADRQRQFQLAQEFYLQADYFEAEMLLKKNLNRGTIDIESSLLWVSILRRTRRLQQALETIEGLLLTDAALPWGAEIRSEKEQCLRLKIQNPPAHQ
jgi:hypothetical protein